MEEMQLQDLEEEAVADLIKGMEADLTLSAVVVEAADLEAMEVKQLETAEEAEAVPSALQPQASPALQGAQGLAEVVAEQAQELTEATEH
jgi:hypothetical protein